MIQAFQFQSLRSFVFRNLKPTSKSLEDQKLRAWRYEDLDQFQRKILQEILQEEKPGAVIFSEVAPVITFGRRARPEQELMAPAAFFEKKGIELYPTDRGGLATYHGPGQWVVFVVERLERLTGDPRGIRKAVDGLLLSACRVAERFGQKAEIRCGKELGVWTARGKIAAVGVRVRQGVLQHGLALNVFQTPESFYGLRPCGLEAPVDFLFEEPDEADFQSVQQALSDEIMRVFEGNAEVCRR